MHPITFECRRFIPRSGEEICAAVANPALWSEFKGFGMLPGIASAEYETRTDTMVGSRIRVRNTDGSAHVEEVRRWVPGREIGMTLREFTPPLGRLASHFTEDWTLQAAEGGTRVTRAFQLFPRTPAAWPAVWLISRLFRRAIMKHLEWMAGA